MEYQSESANARGENIVPEEELHRTFHYTGLCYALLLGLHLALAFGISFLLARFAPDVYRGPWGLYLSDTLPFYLVAVPLCAILMYRLPRQVPQKRRIGAARYTMMLLVAVLFLVAGALVGNFVNMILKAITGNPPSNISDTISGGNVFVTLLMVGVLAPVVEEFIFRKVLIDGVRRFGESIAILLSGLVFGLAHGNFGQCFYAVGLGLVFAYIYCKSGKLYLTIIPHVVINSMSVILTYKVMPRAMEVYDVLPQLMESGMTDEVIAVLRAGIVPLILMLLYVFIEYNAAFVGFIVLLLRRRSISFEPCYLILQTKSDANGNTLYHRPARATIFRTAFGNIGMLVLGIIILFYFVMSIL